jgi:hypothetical protein
MRRALWVFSVSALLLWSVPVLASEGPGGHPGENGEGFTLSARQIPNSMVADAKSERVGMKINLPSPSGGFAVQAEGSSVQIDANGDGTLDTKIKEGQIATFLVKYEDGETLNYFVRFYRERNAMYYESATGMSGKVFGEPFTLIDADCNGKFNDLGKDAVLVGKDKWAVPLGNVVAIKDKLYTLRVDPKGKKVTAEAYAGETGTLDMMKSFKGPVAPQYAIVQCAENYFNLSARGGMKVPCGKYALFKGRLDTGKKSCDIRRGQMKEIEVATGATAQPEWGPPLRIVFKPRMTGEKVHMDASFLLLGKADEQYTNFAPGTMVPEILIKGKDGSVLEKGKFATG